jgi:hypothetical protein
MWPVSATFVAGNYQEVTRMDCALGQAHKRLVRTGFDLRHRALNKAPDRSGVTTFRVLNRSENAKTCSFFPTRPNSISWLKTTMCAPQA